jgi:lactate dehydrogenase-like 2-hydroxyacid dehydrogenase
VIPYLYVFGTRKKFCNQDSRTMKVFITNIIPEAGLKLLKDSGIEIEEWKERRNLSPEELIQKSKQTDALLVAGYSVIDAHFLHECNHLKVIALHSVGFDRVDIAEATKLKIPIGNTPGVVSAATADTAFLLMLAVSRKAFFQYRRIMNGDWNFFEPTANLGIELYGKTLGIYGLGNIGFELAKRCVGAYDMNIIYHNRNHNEYAEKELNAKMVSFEDLLRRSDIISVHSVLSDETKGRFDKSAFNRMKPSSIFINSARGAIHNEKDLIEALQKGTIWGAGLDVTNPEPMAPDNILLTMQNVAVLPHIGTATIETRNAMATIAAQNIIAGLKGEIIPHPVNPDVYHTVSF